MLPLNDIEPNRYIHFPFMTATIICANVIILGFELTRFVTGGPVEVTEFFRLYGAIPNLILQRQGGGGLSAVTHLFVHGDMFHLLGNMLILWVYGRRVEDACGPWRFLFFYLVCGVFAVIVDLATRATSNVPGIGASGAIAGVIGAYLILFPGGRIRTLILLGVVPIFPKIRAFWLILYFFALQILPAFDILFNGADYQIGYWAHLGGFFGSLFVFLFLRPEAFHRYRNELPL